jgi:chromosome segregation ATPase
MSTRWLVERRLSDSAQRLKRLRTELSVVDEQLAALADAADDSRLRALVSETPLADREHRENQRHADAMARHRADLASTIADLERSQDELLDRLGSEIDA